MTRRVKTYYYVLIYYILTISKTTINKIRKYVLINGNNNDYNDCDI